MKKLTFLVSLILIVSLTANAQGWLNKLGDAAKNAAKRTVENRVEKKAADETDKAIDKLEKKGKKKDKNQTADSDSNTSKVSNEKGKNASLQSFSKFDFVPGEKVVFYEDFTQDAIGDFPALWYSNGSGEVVNLNNYAGNWLVIKAPGFYYPEKDLTTTENFTIEFDLKALIRMDSTAQMQNLKLGIDGAILCTNEARQELGLKPVEGGDSPMVQQQNYSLAALAKRDSKDNPFEKGTVYQLSAKEAKTEFAKLMGVNHEF